MDRKLSKAEEIQRLIGVGDAARIGLGDHARRFRLRLDFPARLRGSLKTHPTGWIVGSLAIGLAVSLLFRRRPAPTDKKPRGLMMVLLGLALTAARPFAKVWLTDQVTNYLTGQPVAWQRNRSGIPSRPPKFD